MAIGEVDFEERLKQRIGRASRVLSVAIRFTPEELAVLSEVAALNLEDLAWVEEGAVLTLQRSKTDQEGQGRQVAIRAERMPRPARSSHCRVGWKSHK